MNEISESPNGQYLIVKSRAQYCLLNFKIAFSFRGFTPDPRQGALPLDLDLTGDIAPTVPYPHYRLALSRSPWLGTIAPKAQTLYSGLAPADTPHWNRHSVVNGEQQILRLRFSRTHCNRSFLKTFTFPINRLLWIWVRYNIQNIVYFGLLPRFNQLSLLTSIVYTCSQNFMEIQSWCFKLSKKHAKL